MSAGALAISYGANLDYFLERGEHGVAGGNVGVAGAILQEELLDGAVVDLGTAKLTDGQTNNITTAHTRRADTLLSWWWWSW